MCKKLVSEAVKISVKFHFEKQMKPGKNGRVVLKFDKSVRIYAEILHKTSHTCTAVGCLSRRVISARFSGGRCSPFIYASKSLDISINASSIGMFLCSEKKYKRICYLVYNCIVIMQYVEKGYKSHKLNLTPKGRL